MNKTIPALLIFLFIATKLQAQVSELDTKLSNGELQMTFPSIYFKSNSTEYAQMPYTVDSCFKFISANVKNLNSYPVWRDSIETEQLTNDRIKKIKVGLNKFTPSNKIHFENMHKAQKISRRTIAKCTDKNQIQYLLTLNSVLDVSGAIDKHVRKKKGHLDRPVWYCPNCWKRASQGYYKNKRKLAGQK